MLKHKVIVVMASSLAGALGAFGIGLASGAGADGGGGQGSVIVVGGSDAGHFRLGPAGQETLTMRRYRRDTATIETRWRTPSGQLTLTEGMVADLGGRLLPSGGVHARADFNDLFRLAAAVSA